MDGAILVAVIGVVCLVVGGVVFSALDRAAREDERRALDLESWRHERIKVERDDGSEPSGDES